ncbi:unnamed protein product [Gadus morhua 'NCC']
MVSPRDQILFIVFLLPYLVQPAGYHAVGSNVTLRTGYGGNDLVSVDWKQGDDLAVTMIEQAITPFRNFKGRIFLNLTNGDLTLIGVNVSDSGKYTVYLNGKDRNTKQHFIKVIHHVPDPTVTVNCSPEGELMRFCLYTCAGDTSQSEPVSYEWSLPNGALLSASNKTINVTMESLTGPHDQLLCTMRNPVNNATATVMSPPRSTALATTTPHPTSTAPPTTTTAPPTSTAPPTTTTTTPHPTTTSPPSTAPPSPPAERNGYLVSTVILAVILAVILLLSFAFICVNRLKTGVWIWKKEVWGKRKDERNGSSKNGTKTGCPKPLLNQTENNLESSANTQDEDDAV